MSASAVFFLNIKGDVLIQRIYRDDVDAKTLPAAFRTHVLNTRVRDQTSALSPVRVLGSVSFMYLRHNDVYILIVTKRNANAMLAFSFMSQIVTLFRAYFGGDFSENSIKNNFVLIYELMDEILDYGIPQVADPNVLKQYVFQKGFVTEATKQRRQLEAANSTLQVTGAVGWRREGIRYKKNEVFLDIVEQVNVLMNSKGSVLRCDVNGKMIMKAYLSGMPEVKIGLNDRLDDVTFHQAVNLGRYEQEKVVSFVPPDGEFELMKYRCQDGIQSPFSVLPVIAEHGRSRVEITLRISSTFGAKLSALNTVVLIPVPEHTSSADIQVSGGGKAKYDAKRHALVWKFKKFPGESEASLSASVDLIATTKEKRSWAKPPIQLQFHVPMYSASGLRVLYLRVWERGDYKVDKWVRKVARSGSYEIRA